MRIAAFTIENLFMRAKALKLDAHARLNKHFQKQHYSAADHAAIRADIDL